MVVFPLLLFLDHYPQPMNAIRWNRRKNWGFPSYARERPFWKDKRELQQNTIRMFTLHSRLLLLLVHKRTVQLVGSLLSTMLVRVDVQSNHQNEADSDGNGEESDHHYNSIPSSMTTRGPESLHFIHPHAFARIVIIQKHPRNSILYSWKRSGNKVLMVTEVIVFRPIDCLSNPNWSLPLTTQGVFLTVIKWIRSIHHILILFGELIATMSDNVLPLVRFPNAHPNTLNSGNTIEFAVFLARTIQGRANHERRWNELLVECCIRSITTIATERIEIAQSILICGNTLPIHIELHAELC